MVRTMERMPWSCGICQKLLRHLQPEFLEQPNSSFQRKLLTETKQKATHARREGCSEDDGVGNDSLEACGRELVTAHPGGFVG